LDAYNDVVRQNNEVLGEDAFKELRIYVYVLQDPSTKRIFYVGKGGGKNTGAGGNMRVLNHFGEAESWLKQPRPSGEMPDKVRSILEIWRRGEAVNWFVVRHHLNSEDEAFHIESALIDALPLGSNGPLDNLQGGRHANTHGLLSPSGVAALNAPPVNPAQPYPRVLVFPIQRALDASRTPYDAVRSYWSASQDIIQVSPDNPCIAVGLANGISRVVVDINAWHSVTAVSGKWEFTGTVLTDSDLLDRNFSNVLAPAMGYWMRGNYIGAEFNGKGEFRIIRGARDKTSWYPCI
jgi:hypothetical protein